MDVSAGGARVSALWKDGEEERRGSAEPHALEGDEVRLSADRIRNTPDALIPAR